MGARVCKVARADWGGGLGRSVAGVVWMAWPGVARECVLKVWHNPVSGPDPGVEYSG